MKQRDVVEWLLGQTGKNIRLATVLGLGKPNHFLNAVYDWVKADPNYRLTQFTALSLGRPVPRPGLEELFLQPFLDRHFGKDYPDLHYLKSIEPGGPGLPPNVSIHEFYFQAGAYLHQPRFQQNYQCLNYTHVVRCLFDLDIQVVVQLIAKKSGVKGVRYSLSCNPDLTLDLKDLYEKNGKPLLIIGVVHPDLPFLGGDAEVDVNFFAQVVEDESLMQPLFALPRVAVNEVDHAIGFHASQLVVDGGTLQIGIGSLSDAIVNSLLIRQNQNKDYLDLMDLSWGERFKPFELQLQSAPLTKGLYGLSEMLMDGFMHLRKAGILKREVIDEETGRKTYLHGAFFLGSKPFYDWLRNLGQDDYEGLRMSRISKINDLYDPNEILLRKQRVHARFFNTCMQVTLLGGAASETLESGQVVSGVGGQYNFVSMSHELEDARSVLMLRSTRKIAGKLASNIVWGHGQLTIPRHLRDIVITEYGIADLRHKTDEETICALICIADSQFQAELLALAKQRGKVRRDYELPNYARSNTQLRIQNFILQGRKKNAFRTFPFGSDFTEIEERIIPALAHLKSKSKIDLVKALIKSFSITASAYGAELKRMQLHKPNGWKRRLYRRLLLTALFETEASSHV